MIICLQKMIIPRYGNLSYHVDRSIINFARLRLSASSGSFYDLK